MLLAGHAIVSVLLRACLQASFRCATPGVMLSVSRAWHACVLAGAHLVPLAM